MNNKILDLIKQAEQNMHNSDGRTWAINTNIGVEFAKLIIGECLSIYSAKDNGNEVEGTMNYGKAVYKRFGIK